MEEVGHLIELVDLMERLALTLEGAGGQDDPTTLHQVFQSAHNLKSGLAMADLPRASKLIHSVEDGMDRIRRGKAFWSPEWADFFLWAVDGVRQALLKQEDLGLDYQEGYVDRELQELMGSTEKNGEKAEKSLQWGIVMTPEEEKTCHDWVTQGWGLFRVEKLFKKGLSKEVFETLPVLEDIASVGKLISVHPSFEGYEKGPEEQVVRYLFVSQSETRQLADVFFDPLITMREPVPPKPQNLSVPPEGHRILVVDDDVYATVLLKHILSSLGRCDTATGGVQGLEMVKTAWKAGDRYHLVVLDLMMPVMDGQEVLGAIRDFEEEVGLFGLDRSLVVINTANADINQVKKSFRLQADGYLIKPFNVESLKKQIMEMKRRFWIDKENV